MEMLRIGFGRVGVEFRGEVCFVVVRVVSV